MNRKELISYINNSIMLGNVVTEDSEIYWKFSKYVATQDEDCCNVLGAVEVDGFYLKIDNNNKIHLACYIGEDEEVDLGNCIDIIDDESFLFNDTVKSLSGRSVIKIGVFAFTDLPLTKIDFPNLKEIERYSFPYTQLENVVLNKIKVLSGDAFTGTPLKSFRGDEVEVVEDRAFEDCINLQSIILPKVKKINILGQEDIFSSQSMIDIQVPKSCKFVRERPKS